jgi:hypothetical protein
MFEMVKLCKRNGAIPYKKRTLKINMRMMSIKMKTRIVILCKV